MIAGSVNRGQRKKVNGVQSEERGGGPKLSTVVVGMKDKKDIGSEG